MGGLDKKASAAGLAALWAARCRLLSFPLVTKPVAGWRALRYAAPTAGTSNPPHQAGRAGSGMSVAFVFPGQGSQSVSMGKALADAYLPAREAFAAVAAALCQALTTRCGV